MHAASAPRRAQRCPQPADLTRAILQRKRYRRCLNATNRLLPTMTEILANDSASGSSPKRRR